MSETSPSSGTKLGDDEFHLAGSNMAERFRAFDWAATDLGPPNAWPLELKTVVRQIMESSFPAAIVWGPNFTTIYNDAFRPILGNKPEALGRSFAEIWAEAWDEIGPIAERAYAGEATYIENFPLVVDRAEQQEEAFFTFCYSPLRLGDGTVAGMLDTVVETTATVKARADLEWLNHELGHRLKNMLALVQAMASQSLKNVTERDAVAAFGQRLASLATTFDILLKHNWTGASFAQVARHVLAPLDGLGQISIIGPDIAIGSHTTTSLSLLLHELATNSSKYGALSVDAGRVTLSWDSDGETMSLRWLEEGGPPVAEPRRKGFGTRLIERGLGHGTVEQFYRPAGFELLHSVPLGEMAQ